MALNVLQWGIGVHPNIAFRGTSKQQNIEFVWQRSFGALVVNSARVSLISHVPFQLSDDGKSLEAHLVASNPILQALEVPTMAVMVVSGGDAYISPDWYGVENQVPTWNYVAVHIGGRLKKLKPNELLGVLERLSANMEKRLLPKPPWKLDKLSDEIFAKLKRQIVPVRMEVDTIEGTWKLSQNKIKSAIEGVVQGASSAQIGTEVSKITQLMEGVSDK